MYIHIMSATKAAKKKNKANAKTEVKQNRKYCTEVKKERNGRKGKSNNKYSRILNLLFKR